jgi:hypothetical protein
MRRSLILPWKRPGKLKKLHNVQDLYVYLSSPSFVNYFSFGTNKHLYYGASELSPPPMSYDPEADPTVKGALDVIRIANKAIVKLLTCY